MTTTALIQSVAIDQILAQRDAIMRAAENIRDALASAPGFPDLTLNLNRVERFDIATVESIANRDAWSRLMHESGLWTFMDAKARAEWQEQFDRFEFPPFTEENARATIENLHGMRGAMVGRGVAELFGRLSNRHKTNRVGQFTRRLVIEHMGSPWSHGYSVDHTHCSHLDDLVRFLHVLRGLPEPDYRTHGAWRILSDATKGGWDDWPRVARFPFFAVKLFKKGTAHLEFDHQDDVKRLNMALSIQSGGSAIPNDRRGR